MTLSNTGTKLSILITALFVISTIALAVALVFTLRSGYSQDVKTDHQAVINSARPVKERGN